MKYIKVLLIFFLLFFITGCVSYSELNELGIIDIISIDITNDEYLVTINMLQPNESDLKNKNIYSTSCKTLNECLNKLYLSSTKKISFSHLELIAFTPNIKKENYDEIINLFLNRVDSRNTFSTIIVDDTNKLFNYKSEDINDLININSEEYGIVTIKQFDEVIKDILEINLSYIPSLTIDNEIIINGYQSIYEENKLLTKEESIGYNLINNKITKSMFTINEIGFKLNNSLTNIDINKNKVTINITSNYQVLSNNTNIKNDNTIKKKYNNELKKYINAYLENNRLNYFYELIRKYDYKYYRSNNINIDFVINISSSKISNSNIKGGNNYEQ